MWTTKAQISTIVVRCLDSIIPPVSISRISSLCLASVAVQAGLSLPWSQTLKTGFLVTRLIYTVKIWTISNNQKNYQNDEDRMANSVDPDQTSPSSAVWSTCTLFAQTCLPKRFGSLRYYSKLPKWAALTKPTKWLCAQRRLRSAWASAQSGQSSLSAQWVAKDPSFLHADSDDSVQTGRMPRLIWVFAGRTCHFVGFVMRPLKSCKQFHGDLCQRFVTQTYK